MGVSAQQMKEDAKKKKGRGSVRNKDRLAAFAKTTTEVKVDWGVCQADLLWACVNEVTKRGGAVIFGTSRDGGSASVTLMLDNKKRTLWFNGDADLNDELAAVVETLEGMP